MINCNLLDNKEFIIYTKFNLKNKNDNQIVLAFGIHIRIIYLTIFFFILGAIVIANQDGQITDIFQTSNLIPFILAAIIFFAAFYQEKWVFNKSTQQIESFFGLTFLAKKKVFPIEEVANLRMIIFYKGKLKSEDKNSSKNQRKKVLKLVLICKDGMEYTIENMIPGTYYSELEKNTQQIAAFCNIDYTVEESISAYS
ncbi:MAG: hypothetical protein MJB14_07330 [Spirochaetes bacterium]|nr:hypothetical protein [Spirochaetota bacterium]